MNINETIFIAKCDGWGTPIKFFDKLDREFNFTLDPCASKKRPLKQNIISYDIIDNGLEQDWSGHRVYCNPPYSKENFKLWCKKINKERNRAELIVLLCPLRRCSNIYFHDLVLEYAELRIIRGRLDFYPLEGQEIAAANPSGSALCIIRNDGTFQGGK